jgi:hypothetical protein
MVMVMMMMMMMMMMVTIVMVMVMVVMVVVNMCEQWSGISTFPPAAARRLFAAAQP